MGFGIFQIFADLNCPDFWYSQYRLSFTDNKLTDTTRNPYTKATNCLTNEFPIAQVLLFGGELYFTCIRF